MARIRDESRAEWSQRVARSEVSGCSVREFASREGVSEGRLVRWRNKLRKERRQGAMAMVAPRFWSWCLGWRFLVPALRWRWCFAAGR